MAEYQWFVAPQDMRTNEVIATVLADMGRADESPHLGLVDASGKKHDAWQVDYPFIAKLIASEGQFPLRFTILNRSGRNGQLRDMTDDVREWESEDPSTPVSKAKAEIAAILKRKAGDR